MKYNVFITNRGTATKETYEDLESAVNRAIEIWDEADDHERKMYGIDMRDVMILSDDPNKTEEPYFKDTFDVLFDLERFKELRTYFEWDFNEALNVMRERGEKHKAEQILRQGYADDLTYVPEEVLTLRMVE